MHSKRNVCYFRRSGQIRSRPFPEPSRSAIPVMDPALSPRRRHIAVHTAVKATIRSRAVHPARKPIPLKHIFGRRQCVVYAVSCAAFACGMGAHQAVVRTVRRLRRPFRLRRSSSFGLGLVCVGHCLGLLLHARPQRPPGFAAVRYLYGNCRVALAWRAAQFGLAVSAIFRCVFFAFANAAVRRHARRRCAREVEVLPHLSGAVYLNSAAWQAACALNSAPQCRALAP